MTNSLLHFSQNCKDNGNIFTDCNVLSITYKYILVEAFKDKNITITNIVDIDKFNYKVLCKFNNKKYTILINNEKYNSALKAVTFAQMKLK